MSTIGSFPKTRLRRLRNSDAIRSLLRETHLNSDKWIYPLFIKHGHQIIHPISSMPGHFQRSVDELEKEIKILWQSGIKSVLLFGIPKNKDELGSDSYSKNGIIQTAIPVIKNAAPEMLVVTDVCFCEYTDHGHCGVIHSHSLDSDVHIDNDKTLALIAKQALSHVEAGADIVAPSGAMDGMVHAIRQHLDLHNHSHIPILSYSVKYASAMYGPFRQAAEGAPQFGDRRTYQMDYARGSDAIRESALDIDEGADMLMVKPGHTYLDLIYQIKQAFPALPLGAYHTSGEFAMIKAAAEKGWIDEKQAVFEILTAIHRAGADFIITYYAKEAALWLKQSSL